MAKKKAATDTILLELREFGLAYPGAHLKSPWPGHKDLAVNDKTFAYLSVEGEPLHVGCKLPTSSAMALMLPGATPMAYGLGKSGWVSLDLGGVSARDIDVAMLKAWIDESYRAQAPKSLVKKISANEASPAPARSPRTRRAGAKRTAAGAGRG
jgi:predicted DNA-binding protein (MmcQ/YjbR family)|nr:MmcQ/YjbR family DNA-binding protein [Kofleriaceae bacterium]